MKNKWFLFIALIAVMITGCKKELDVEGPELASGAITITLTSPTAGEVIASNQVYTVSGNILAPRGLKEAWFTVFGTKYEITANGANVPFSVNVIVPENIPTGQTYTLTVYATDFDDNTKTLSGDFTLSQSMSAMIISPYYGVSNAVLAGLNATFKMRLNAQAPPTSVSLNIKYSEANIQTEAIDLNNPDEFFLDPDAGKNSYIIQKTLTIPGTTAAGVYDYWFEVVTATETVQVKQKLEVQAITEAWVLGDATTAGWDIDNPIALNNTGPNQFTKSLDLEADPKGFKFVLTKGSWAVNWGTTGTAPLTLDTEYDLIPNGENMKVAVTGNYVISINFTTNKFKVKAFTAPDSLYLVGGSTPAGWDPNLALPFTKKAPGIFEIWSPLTTDGFGFKFLPQHGSWDGDWGQKPGQAGTIIQDGEENCTVTENGFYRITVDFNTMTFTTEKFEWGIIGSAIPPYNWSVDVDMTWGGTAEPFTWVISNYTVQAGEFKFRANDAWTTNFGDDGTNGSLEYNGANIPIAAGTWTIKMILTPGGWTYSVTP